MEAFTDMKEALPDGSLIVSSEALRKLLTMAGRIARSSTSVFIWGETGVGKELVARYLHVHSKRADKPFVELNCAALPENLVESELFGYEKGAFSGADASKPGLFEVADGGTLFLDEIGELDMKVQAKLLRILDGSAYYRLGGNRKINVDVRIIAATNRSLEEAVGKGSFRADLFHRIAQFQLHVPPLRERLEDVVSLAHHFLRQNEMDAMTVLPETIQVLQVYSWPGNARELRNTILQAAMQAEGTELRPEHLPPHVRQGNARVAQAPTHVQEQLPAQSTMEDTERRAILQAIQATGGNHTAAANVLGISRRTLLRKLKQYREESPTEVVAASSQAMGKLSKQQHQSYRCAVEVPVELKTASKEIPGARTVNISMGGLGIVGVDNAFDLVGPLSLAFEIDGQRIEAKATLQWAEPTGRIGLQFVSMSKAGRLALSQWLRKRQLADGWAVEDSFERIADGDRSA